MSTEVLWGFGTLALLAGLIYGTVQWHNRSRRLEALGDAASQRIYEREDQKSKQRSTSVS